MSENALWAGWQVYRERRSAAVDADRTRRRTVLSGTVAVAVGAVAVVAQVLWQWSGSATVWFLVSVPAIALAAGGMTAFCVPVRRGEPPRRAPAGWRETERIDAYFSRRPPAVEPDDRDVVIDRVEQSRDATVGLVDRLVWLPVAWLALGLAILATGAAADKPALLIMPVMGLIQAGVVVQSLVALGRMDAARRRAEALDPVDPASVPEPPIRNRDPRGSKLRLPGD